MYVTEDAFAADDPYTEAYVTVQGATNYRSGSSDYQSAVDSVAERISQMNPSLASLRCKSSKMTLRLKLMRLVKAGAIKAGSRR